MFYEDSKSNHNDDDDNCIEIGIGLIVLGLIIYCLGVFLFLDRGMLAIGNVRN